MKLKVKDDTFGSVKHDVLFELLEGYGPIPRGTIGFKTRTPGEIYFVAIANHPIGLYHCGRNIEDVKIRVLHRGSLSLEIEE